MDKQLKRSYENLDLPYSATIEDVEMRKNALIKVCHNEELEKKTNHTKQINEIEFSAENIISNLKKNGAPKEERHTFDSSWGSIGLLGIILLFIVGLCWFSFYIFT